MNRRQQIIQQKYLNSESEIIRSLDELYKDSAAEVAESIRKKYKEIAELTDAIENLADDDPQKAVLESMRQSKVYQRNYQERLKKELDSIMDKMSKKEYTSISDYLNECYEDGFIGTLYDLHGQGVPFTIPMNQEAVVRAVQIDSKINVKLYERLKQDVDELKKKIASSVSNMLVTGKSYSQVSEEILRHSNIGRNRAIRIARTEGHRIQTTASMDALTSAKEIGADVVKQWDSTLDGKTRPSHIMTDGEIRELEEPFSNDLMFPGDPNGEAKEVVNCRCALLNRARWALDDGFTKMDGFIGEIRSFESPDEYSDFKKWYWSDSNKKMMKYVESLERKHNTKDFKKLLKSLSNKEYSAYKKIEKAWIASAESQWKEYLKLLRTNSEVRLRKRQADLLEKVPKRNQWVELRKKQVGINDLAALTAYTGDEFAIFTGQNSKILIHGGTKWYIPEDAWEIIKKNQYTWDAHSHPTFLTDPNSSAEDRKTLKLFTWQKESYIIDLNGKVVKFTDSEQDWINKLMGIK